MITLLRRGTQKDVSAANTHETDFQGWIIASLSGAFVCAFGVLLISLWTMIRYLADFMPALAMLSVLGFWRGYQLLAQKPRHQRMYSIMGIILAGASITVNILLSISVRYLGRTGL
jgi:hypothetical protein